MVRASRVQSFMRQTRITSQLNPFSFWQLRDEYGTGLFSVDTDHTIFRETQVMVTYPIDTWVNFAQYHGSYVQSYDYLTPPGAATQSAQMLDHLGQWTTTGGPVFQTDTLRIYENQHETVVVFLLPLTDMAKVYGLYNFSPDTLEKLKGRLWANVTAFQK